MPDDEAWQERLDDLVEQIRRWSGSPCEPLVLPETELLAAVRRGDRLVAELRRDAIHLAGVQPHVLLGRRAG